ncbi:MAG: ACT domain-containing protein, partial [Clostridia bacterium]|nr:ACT domain-containing protein [Clostridia bacterium]
ADCINITNLSDVDSQRFIEVWWSNNQNSDYTSDLQIIANDRNGLMVDVMNVVSAAKSAIRAVNSRVTKDNLAIINITAVVSSQEQIQKLMKLLRGIESVTSVSRLKH